MLTVAGVNSNNVASIILHVWWIVCPHLNSRELMFMIQRGTVDYVMYLSALS